MMRIALVGLATSLAACQHHTPTGSNEMDPPLLPTALKSQNGCSLSGNHSPQGGESHGTDHQGAWQPIVSKWATYIIDSP